MTSQSKALKPWLHVHVFPSCFLVCFVQQTQRVNEKRVPNHVAKHNAALT